MDCLENYIGIKGCGSDNEEPSSGLLINDLPGVSLEMIQSLADAEMVTFLGVWDIVQKRALKKFALNVKAELNKCYKITNAETISCLVCEEAAVDSFGLAYWYLCGVELMIERTSSDQLNWYTTVDLEKAERLKAEFYDEYISALSAAVNSLDPESSDCVETCLPCNSDVRWKEQTP